MEAETEKRWEQRTWQERVQSLLVGRGTTWRWLAIQIGMDKAQISRLRRGTPVTKTDGTEAYYRLTPEIRKAIAQALNVEQFMLFEGEEAES